MANINNGRFGYQQNNATNGTDPSTFKAHSSTDRNAFGLMNLPQEPPGLNNNTHNTQSTESLTFMAHSSSGRNAYGLMNLPQEIPGLNNTTHNTQYNNSNSKRNDEGIQFTYLNLSSFQFDLCFISSNSNGNECKRTKRIFYQFSQ